MLTNKHVVAALVITPILAVFGYFAMDIMVAEKPIPAVAGQSYKLLARPRCHYTSGQCSMVNGDFEIDIKGVYQPDGRLTLKFTSVFPLQGGRVAVVDATSKSGEPVVLKAVDNSARLWSVTLPASVTAEDQIRVAFAASHVLYFGETGLVFTHYETSFGKDFREADSGAKAL